MKQFIRVFRFSVMSIAAVSIMTLAIFSTLFSASVIPKTSSQYFQQEYLPKIRSLASSQASLSLATSTAPDKAQSTLIQIERKFAIARLSQKELPDSVAAQQYLDGLSLILVDLPNQQSLYNGFQRTAYNYFFSLPQKSFFSKQVEANTLFRQILPAGALSFAVAIALWGLLVGLARIDKQAYSFLLQDVVESIAGLSGRVVRWFSSTRTTQYAISAYREARYPTDDIPV